jgi:hypothetical protein
MATAVVGVGRQRWSRVTVMSQWVLPLASAPTRSVRRCMVCGGTVDTANVGSHAPLFVLHCARGTHCNEIGRRPQSGRVRRSVP